MLNLTDRQAEQIAVLGRLCGIAPEYRDNWGRRWATSTATYQALLRAMGVAWEEPAHLAQEIEQRRRALRERLLPPVSLLPPVPRPQLLTLNVSSPSASPPPLEVQAELRSDTGELISWQTSGLNGQALRCPAHRERWPQRFAIPLPIPLEMGYYEVKLAVKVGGRVKEGTSFLIVAPEQTYLPDFLRDGRRLWGLSAPLYALKSARNWGIGDFTDLTQLVAWAGELGAAFVGVNPLHAPLPRPDADPSPYSPATRLGINFLYLDVEAVPELALCPQAQNLLADPLWQADRQRLRQAPQVAYENVHRLKNTVLTLLFQTFLHHHGAPQHPLTRRGQDFAAYVQTAPPASRLYARYQALADIFQEGDWRRWPASYQDPTGPAVAAWSEAHPEAVLFHQYVQWLATAQLAKVRQKASTSGLPFSLYQDLALGAHPGGFETWAYPGLFALNAAMGAPPDAFNPKGQNWGLPPMIPEALRASGYRLFIDTLRANCPPQGILRLDHVMGLFRLFWLPQGKEGAEGAYVYYPARELLAILALESQRRRTLIIGEDLGTVPPRVRRELARRGVFSYRVFYFERNQEGNFRPPDDYPSQALAAVTTHDLPTLAGFWQGEDIRLKRRYRLYPAASLAAAEENARPNERRALVAALQREALLPADFAPHPDPGAPCPEDVRFGLLEYLGRSRAALLEVRLEEVLGVSAQQNLPGTTLEHPNWRQKIPLSLAELRRTRQAARLAHCLQNRRTPSSP